MKVLKGVLYWLWQCTYGVLMTAIGAVVVLVLICCGCKPKRFHYNIYIEVGKNWGGVNLGAFFLTCKGAGLSTRQHEAGHGLQNLWWGILFPFVIAIPSAVRYWYREWYYKHKYPVTKKTLPEYDAIWFEGQATRLGQKYFN